MSPEPSQSERDDEAIHQRAYEIWQGAGSPDGLHGERWARAKRELARDALV
jgi:hypothetical protein